MPKTVTRLYLGEENDKEALASGNLLNVDAIEDWVGQMGFTADLPGGIRCLPPQRPFFKPQLRLKPKLSVFGRVRKFLISSQDNNAGPVEVAQYIVNLHANLWI